MSHTGDLRSGLFCQSTVSSKRASNPRPCVSKVCVASSSSHLQPKLTMLGTGPVVVNSTLDNGLSTTPVFSQATSKTGGTSRQIHSTDYMIQSTIHIIPTVCHNTNVQPSRAPSKICASNNLLRLISSDSVIRCPIFPFPPRGVLL
jgi:hypothetical protein